MLNMKIHIPTDPGWYVAAICIFAPMVMIAVIEPEWLGRLMGICLWFVFPPFYPILAALRRQENYYRDSSPLYKRFHKEAVDEITRMLVLLIGIAGIWLLTVPTLKDLRDVVNNSAPLSRTGFVTRASGVGRGLVLESVVLDSYVGTDENSLTGFYFPPRHIMQGNTYEFLYLPNTRIILEAHRVPDVATTTSQVLQ